MADCPALLKAAKAASATAATECQECDDALTTSESLWDTYFAECVTTATAEQKAALRKIDRLQAIALAMHENAKRARDELRAARKTLLETMK